MTERKGRIEDDTYRGTIFVLLADGKVFEFNSGKYDIETFVGTVAQGNAFYDRESAELAARKRAAQVKFERLCEKFPDDDRYLTQYEDKDGKYYSGKQIVEMEMGEDMELLK